MGIFSVFDFIKKCKESESNESTRSIGIGKYRDEVNRIINESSLVGSNNLENIATEYNIKESICKKISLGQFVKYIRELNKRNRIDTNEFSKVVRLMEYFGIEYRDYIEDAVILHDKYTIWLIEETDFMPIYDGEVEVFLKNGEKVHYAARANLLNNKERIDYIRYSGFTSNIRICEGFFYRSGSIELVPQKKCYVEEVDEGMFYITNLRTIFIGRKGNFSYHNSKILHIDYTEYGLVIQKENTKTPQILQLNDYELPLVMLSHILNR